MEGNYNNTEGRSPLTAVRDPGCFKCMCRVSKKMLHLITFESIPIQLGMGGIKDEGEGG